MVGNGQQNQDSPIGRLAADSPLLKKVDRVTLDVAAVERVDGDDGNLGVRFLVDLLTQVVELGDGAVIENVGEVVDVAGRLELGNGFAPANQGERQHGEGAECDCEPRLHPRLIVQDGTRPLAQVPAMGEWAADHWRTAFSTSLSPMAQRSIAWSSSSP